MELNLPPFGNEYTQEGAVLSNLRASAQSDPSMSVHVSPGGCWVNGKNYIEFAGGNTANFVAPASNSKWCLLVIQYNAFLQIVDGTAQVGPSLPTCPRNCVPIAAIYMEAGTTKITSDMVFDLRPVISGGIFSHLDLDNRDALNQHPISSIIDLTTTLGNMPTNLDLDTAMDTKADKEGTVDTTFTLNKDYVGTPVSNVKLEIERGSQSNVFIRWNETIDSFDFTNNGTTFKKIQSAIYISDELIGTGLPQNISHDLGDVPSKVFVTLTSGTGTVVEGAHDNASLTLNVTNGVKFKVMAI